MTVSAASFLRRCTGGSILRVPVLAVALAAAVATAAAQEQPDRERATEEPPSAGARTDAPAQAPQESVRRTRRLSRERRPVAHEPRARIQGGLGYGWFEINASELGQRDREGAAVLRVDFEMWPLRHIGFGVSSELVSTGDDLFDDQMIESGVGPREADAQASTHDLSAYFAWDPVASERVRLPLQIGPWFHGMFLDYDRARVDYRVSTAGVRIGTRPEFAVVHTDDTDLRLFAGVTYSIGFTRIDEDLIGSDETYDTEQQQFRVEAGLRLDLRRVTLGLHYVYSDNGINLSDPEHGRRLPEIDYDTNMVFFTIGGRF